MPSSDQEKAKALRGKGDKLIVLRHALFDDDQGGFGAERDVTRWLAAPFRKFTKNGLELGIEFAHGESLMGQDLADLLALAEAFAEEVEEDAGREYYAEDKEEHLTEDAARFLVVRDYSASGSNKIVGFAHFRFTLHGELADEMEGEPCLFVYDLHVLPELQRKGVGRHLVTMLELIARKAKMAEMLMPVPNSPLADDVRAFIDSGLKDWASDDLADVAPKTAEALSSDGSLEVFVKCLQPRASAAGTTPTTAAKAATTAPAPAPAAAQAAAPVEAGKGSAVKAAEPPLPPPAADAVAGADAAASAGAKSKKNKKKKNKKGAKAAGKDSSGKVLDATTANDSSVGSSVATPLAVE